MFDNLGSLGLWAKALAGAAAAAAVTALNAMQNGDIAPDEWVTIVVAFIVGLGALLAVPSFPEGAKKVLKAIIAAVVAAAGVLTVALVSGTPLGAIIVIKIVLAVLATFGITYTVPEAADSDPINPRTKRRVPVYNRSTNIAADVNYTPQRGVS